MDDKTEVIQPQPAAPKPKTDNGWSRKDVIFSILFTLPFIAMLIAYLVSPEYREYLAKVWRRG